MINTSYMKKDPCYQLKEILQKDKDGNTGNTEIKT